ncbi:MAG: hypothetical protein EXX96DRAFT_505072 [Benjaminiella poitrasii]|nr:MAG: hypothetical protein EXX96DRAFT_505072 [Benjaminiella poitrasii]
MKQFRLSVAISSLYVHISEKCCLALTQASKYTIERDAPRTFNLCYEIINKWIEVGVDFKKNYMFIDEAGFHSQMTRGRAWSKVGTPANVKVHIQKDVNLGMIGYIYARRIISFTKVIPLKVGNVELIEKEFHSEVSAKKKKAQH